jgi:hypothetical protein
VKVAQYEVLGNEAKDTSVPAGTIDQCRQSLMPLRDQEAERSIVPTATGTDSSLKTLTQHFVLGYFRQVPAGLIFSNQNDLSILTATP